MEAVELLGKAIEVSHSNLEVPARINAILNMISHALDFEEVVLYTYDKDKRLTCRYTNDKGTLFSILNQYRCHVGEGIVGSVAQRREPRFFAINEVPPRLGCLFYPQLDEVLEHYRSFVFLPLADDSYLYGVLLLGSIGKETVRDREKILLSILSREIGGILRSFDLIFSSKKRISELATLSELGKVLTSNLEPSALLKDLVLIIAKALSARFVTIRLDPAFLRLEVQRFTYGPVDAGIEGYVEELEAEAFKARRVVSIQEKLAREDRDYFKFTLYAAPILSKERLLGTLTICGEALSQDVTSQGDGQYLISTVANYISSGLENRLLTKKLRDVVKELNDAQKTLIEQEKLRSLGEMTANIAHEIKNPLVVIGGFTKRLAKRAGTDSTQGKYIDIIVREVARLEAILNEVLDYAREVPLRNETCRINEYVNEILYLFSSDATWSRIAIERDLDNELPTVMCDVQQMRQVFINILVNAAEAMKGKGTLTIKTEQVELDGRLYAGISITDTGGGIEPSAVDNIFNPFFSTKEKGSGLGLAISNKIVKNHKGRIGVSNSPGKGATFTVYLPIRTHTTTEGLP